MGMGREPALPRDVRDTRRGAGRELARALGAIRSPIPPPGAATPPQDPEAVSVTTIDGTGEVRRNPSADDRLCPPPHAGLTPNSAFGDSAGGGVSRGPGGVAP